MIDYGKKLQMAYADGYKQGRYDEMVETEVSLPRWIPCSERLPEPYEDVLVYYEYCRHYDYGAMTQTYGIGFCSSEGTWHGDVSGLNARCLAWMPLPSPYEGG